MKRFLIATGIIIILAGVTTFVFANKSAKSKQQAALAVTAQQAGVQAALPPEPPKPVITHLTTPTPVKALYMSSWIASSAKLRQHVLNLIDTTEANAIIIDIKDDTGRLSFLVDDPSITAMGVPENRIRDIIPFINELHGKNIYVIGRISTFQDPYMSKLKPEWAIKKKSDGSVWKDRKGLAFLDPANKNVWPYLVSLAEASYNIGFDEINFDYIRYPSDGNIKDINYNLTADENGVMRTRSDNLQAFSKHLYETLKKDLPGIKISADLFGLTTTATDDMGIGQVLEKELPYFDYIAPMVYPSHYGHDFQGKLEPAKHPYEVVFGSMKGAVEKLNKLKADPATPPDIAARLDIHQLRPWLQDFKLAGVAYTADMIKLEKKATYDNGIDSWMIWDPSNVYTAAAYNPQ